MQKNMSIIRSESAVSETLGMVLMLSISMTAIAGIMLVGMPMIDSSKTTAKMNVIASSFLSLQNDVGEVIRGPIWILDPNVTTNINGPSRESVLDLSDGYLYVSPNTTKAIFKTYGKNNNNYNITIPSSSITYKDNNNNEIVYENGAIIRKYVTGSPIMISDPLINIYNIGDGNITVSMHLVTINSSLSSIGGEGEGFVDIRLQRYNATNPSYNETIISTSKTNSNQTIININSKYPEAWLGFFNKKLQEAISNNSKSLRYSNYTTPSSLKIMINGSMPNSTFLSLYESRLDVNVK